MRLALRLTNFWGASTWYSRTGRSLYFVRVSFQGNCHSTVGFDAFTFRILGFVRQNNFIRSSGVYLFGRDEVLIRSSAARRAFLFVSVDKKPPTIPCHPQPELRRPPPTSHSRSASPCGSPGERSGGPTPLSRPQNGHGPRRRPRPARRQPRR